VRGVQPARRFHRDAQGDLQRQSAPRGGRVRDQVRRRHPVHEVHDQEGAVLVLADVEHADDVRVPDRPRQARLVEEHRAKARVLPEVLVQALARVPALERPLAADDQLDRAHSALGQLADVLVGRRRQGQTRQQL
jgi:hypothetical protein